MSTAKNKKAAIVGIFIFIGLAILVALILLLGGQKKTFSRSITLMAVFDDVSGLQQGNNVWLAGVKVGTVRTISFDSNAKVVVTLGVLANVHPYIHQDAKAKIGSESLIGNKIVVIDGGSPQLPLIASGGFLKVQKTLGAQSLMDTLQQNNRNLLTITENLKTIADRLVAGQGSIGKLLTDETLVNTLQSSLNSLQAAASNAKALTANLSGYTAKLQTPGSLTNDLVTDTIVFNSLRHTAIQLQQIAQSAGGVVDQLQNAGAGLNKSIHNTSTPVGVLLNDQQAASNIKATLNNLQSGTQKLNEDLEALQHNFLFRGFFRKRAKEKEKLKAKE